MVRPPCRSQRIVILPSFPRLKLSLPGIHIDNAGTFSKLLVLCEAHRHWHRHYGHCNLDHHNDDLLVRLELLLLDWFFNDDDDAVCTSFLNGAVDVLAKSC